MLKITMDFDSKPIVVDFFVGLRGDNNKAQYTFKNKNGWSHKYISKVKKKLA